MDHLPGWAQRECVSLPLPLPLLLVGRCHDFWSSGRSFRKKTITLAHRQEQGLQCLAYTQQQRAISFQLEVIWPVWGSELAHSPELSQQPLFARKQRLTVPWGQ